MTIQILGDPHTGKTFLNNVPLHRRGEREKLQWEKFQQELKPKPGTKYHICVGDLFDKAIVPFTVVMKAARLYIEAATSHPNVTFIVLRGNHDASRDLEAVSAFDVFREIVSWVKNLIVLCDPMIIDDGTPMAFFPWSPVKSAEELVRTVSCISKNGIAFGHWDTDPRSDPFNLIPTAVLAEQGFTKAYTGHVHLPATFQWDNVDVIVTGSMLPYAHGEDATGETYVTISLDEARADPDALKNKCVRIVLQEGELFDLELDCLQLQVTHAAEVATEQLDVSLGEFDLGSLFDATMNDHGVPTSIKEKVQAVWAQHFTVQR